MDPTKLMFPLLLGRGSSGRASADSAKEAATGNGCARHSGAALSYFL